MRTTYILSSTTGICALMLATFMVVSCNGQPQTCPATSPPRLALTVFRLDDKPVADSDKQTQGSIACVLDPDLATHLGDLGFPVMPRRIEIELRWQDIPLGDANVLIEEGGPSAGIGALRVYGGGGLLKGEALPSATVPIHAAFGVQRLQVLDDAPSGGRVESS